MTDPNNIPVVDDELENELENSERYFDTSGTKNPGEITIPDGDESMRSPERGEKEKETVQTAGKKITLKQKKILKRIQRHGTRNVFHIKKNTIEKNKNSKINTNVPVHSVFPDMDLQRSSTPNASTPIDPI